MSIEREVAWGEAAEERIVQRWLKLSPFAEDCETFRKSDEFRDFDFYIEAKGGYVRCYVEVKRRRTDFAKYGDAIFPLRKHNHARRESLKTGIPHIAVTEYGCGTLVEVNLAKKPASTKDVARRDRPGMKPVPHAFYTRRQLTVLEEA